MTPQEKIDALWEKARADADFVNANLDDIERITVLIDMGDVDLALPIIDKLLK